jgi:Ca2+-binding RTX toxin-like protein
MRYDPIEITKLLVFGTANPSSTDYNEHIRSGAVEEVATPGKEISISYNMNDYMTSGAGRFAYASLFGAVQKVFNSTMVIPDGTYTFDVVKALMGLSDSEDFSVSISHYGTGIGSADHAERSYIFGTSAYALDTSKATLNVSGGIKKINGLEVQAKNDGFDFKGGNLFANIVNGGLKQTLDPYSLRRSEVVIEFNGPGRAISNYTQEDFTSDKSKESDVLRQDSGTVAVATGSAKGIASLLVNGGVSYFLSIDSDPLFSYKKDDLKVIYGTSGDDNLNNLSAELTLDAYFGYLMAGGDGNDTLSSGLFADELQGGNGNDVLNSSNGDDTLNGGAGDDSLDGGLGDDTFIGGAGNDTFEGGSFLFGLFQGTDTSKYSGALADYDIEFLPDNVVKINDKVLTRDGSDTLKGIDIAAFSDKSINLSPGQDIAFVIDTTGSMFDDIDAVKARSGEIISAIFDGERSVLNSRIAVVGYNDPDTNTFLSFTDQSKIADRKTAAINAINSISVGGGGDIPEAVNAGLIRALSGGAGKWRKEAIARRIILFGDAPPKDEDLRARVLELAGDIGVDVPRSPMSIETSNIADGLVLKRFALSATATNGTITTFPVEIFTVLIGDDLSTKNDFSSLSKATGGRDFSAADASQVVDALIKAIATPVNSTPIVANLITDQFIKDSSLFSFSIPINSFSDADSGDVLTYSASLPDGQNLPTWLKFDSATNSLSGTPSKNDVGDLQIKVTATDLSNASVSDIFNINVTPSFSLQKATEDIWTVNGNGNVKVAITGKNSNQLNEIGVFKLAADNTVNGIAVGAAGFAQAALANSTTVFTALPDNTTDGLDLSRIFNVADGDRLGFFMVANGTIEENLKYNNFNNVVFSIDPANPGSKDYLQVTEKAGAFTLDWEQGNDNTFQDLSISLTTDSSPESPLSPISSLQGQPAGEILDLRAFAGQNLQATFTVKREAAYNNVAGFYKIDDVEGTVTSLTGAKLKPQDSGYKEAALSNKIAGLDIIGENQKTITIEKTVTGGAMYAPYLIINGNNPGFAANLMYTAFSQSNFAQADRVRLLGENTFGFEDLIPQGGDFNDLVVQASFKTV